MKLLLKSKSLLVLGFWISVLYFLVRIESSLSSAINGLAGECLEKEKCGDCIQTPGCAWCSEFNFHGKRCRGITEMELSHCNDIHNPQKQPPDSEPRENQTDGDTVTITPGKYTVYGRVGDKINITIEFNDEPRKPLDLYYLLDSSCTMAAVIEQVKSSALELARNLEKLTSDLRLGLGGFVDKTVVPFISDPRDVLKTMDCYGQQTIGAYGYRNYLRMSNSSMFAEAMNDHQISFNQDDPEGQLDALMQAVLCESVIDWKEDRIRLIVLATDAGFHIAGDGKLGGIILPHDGQCHTETQTSTQDFVKVKTYEEYTHSTKLDYPSIALLNKKIKEKRVRVVFAVKNHVELYKELSKSIKGSSVVELTETGNNIQKLIEDEFEKLTNTVEVGRFPESECFGGTYYALCPSQSDYVKGGKCLNRNNLNGPRNITFKIELEIKKCDSPTATAQRCSHNLEIPIGLTQKKMIIDIKPICECSCTDTTKNTTRRKEQDEKITCENGGRFNCGICECRNNFCGANCQTNTDDESYHRSCRQDGVECSDRGTCKCGKCRCHFGYQGPYCEYDRAYCPQNDGVICSGSGSCNATTNSVNIQSFWCDCFGRYTGSACACSPSKTNCRNSFGTECSNNGNCECNSCKCLDGYCGTLCQHCFFKDQEPSTLNTQEFKKCLQCYLAETSIDQNQNRTTSSSEDKCLPECQSANVGKVIVVNEIDEGCARRSTTANLDFATTISKMGCDRNVKSCGIGQVSCREPKCTHNFTYECTPWNKTMITVKLNYNRQPLEPVKFIL